MDVNDKHIKNTSLAGLVSEVHGSRNNSVSYSVRSQTIPLTEARLKRAAVRISRAQVMTPLEQEHQHAYIATEMDNPNTIEVQMSGGREGDAQLPHPPYGYVLWQGQPLDTQADMPGSTGSKLLCIDGWEYARIGDLVIPGSAPTYQHTAVSTELPKRLPLDVLAHWATIGQYVYTGDADEDLEALRSYYKRCTAVLKVFEADEPPNRAAAAKTWELRQRVRLTRDGLRDEIEDLLSEVHKHMLMESPDYGDRGIVWSPGQRAKGYTWTAKV